MGSRQSSRARNKRAHTRKNTPTTEPILIHRGVNVPLGKGFCKALIAIAVIRLPWIIAALSTAGLGNAIKSWLW